jgi:hypothetical protein
MDIERFVGKTIYIRLAEDDGTFVSTVRYGFLFERSTAWIAMEPSPEEQELYLREDPPASE